jgi:hypothetical protein
MAGIDGMGATFRRRISFLSKPTLSASSRRVGLFDPAGEALFRVEKGFELVPLAGN